QPQQPGQGRGRGFGPGGPVELGAWLHIGENGQITVYCGKVEMGQNIRTSLSQAVAEELRVPGDAIHTILADTDQVPFDMGTFGSMTTPRTAAQLHQIGAAARALLIDLAAEEAKVDRGTLTLADGRVMHAPSRRSFTYGELTKGKKLTKTVAADTAITPA